MLNFGNAVGNTMKNVSVAVPVPPGLAAETGTTKTPAVAAVPEMAPLLGSRLSPGGSPLAVKVSAPLLAVSRAATPLVPSATVSVAGLVMTGGGGTAPILKVIVPWPEPSAFVADTLAAKFSALVGLPEITPVVALRLRPGGRFAVEKVVGEFAAVSV